MQVCYAESELLDRNAMEDTLTKWVVGAGLAAMTAILGFLLKWVFGKLTGGIEEMRREMSANADRDQAGHEKIAVEIRALTATVQKQDLSIALMAKDIAHLQEAHFHLQRDFEAHCAAGRESRSAEE